jgi:hypothetical protein
MSDSTVPLSIVSSTNNQQYFWAQMGIGSNILTQEPKTWGYWIVVIDRITLSVVYNQIQTSANTAPKLGNYNSNDYILALATLGVGLNNQPQGDFFQFLDLNGGGQELRRVEQIATQFNCGSLGTFGYALVGVLGNQNIPGFERSQIGLTGVGPILTVQLLPTTIGGKTVYTPVQLSNA